MASRYRVLLPLILILIGLAATSALALKAPDADPTRPGPYVYQLQTRIAQLESVENGLIDPATGAYATLVNQKAGPYTGSAEQVARAYLADKAGRFALARGTSDLVVDAVQVVPGGSHVRFVQSIGGVPIYRADLVVSLDASGKFVTAVASNYDPQVDRGGLSTTATLNAAQAREIAIGVLRINGTPQFTGDTTEGLWIVRDEDIVGSTPHLAWRITVPVTQPLGDWEVFVDARDGQILRLLDQSLYIDGNGSAFDPDPLTTAQATYNTPAGSYADNNDADHPTLAAQTFVRPLPELTFISPLYYLRGPWVYIDEFESPTSPPATSVDPNRFTFTRNQQGFEDTNAYYHIDQNQRYMQSLGFNNIQHAPIHVDTHGLNGDDNSHFIPSTNRIAWGEGGVDDAEDADVLLHEYGHAIQSSSRPGWGGGHQGSMGEGFGDYWAGSYSASISDFKNYWVFNWDGHNPYWTGRILNGTGMYSSWGGGDIYTNGTSWASCLWLMRAEMGRTALDTDVLKHHFYQGTTCTGAQAAQYLMQADKDLYAGLHGGTIENFFVLRGFFSAALYDVPALTHTALPDTVITVGPYSVTVTVTSVSAVMDGSVKVKVGTGGVYNQEIVLDPTGNPNEWGGVIPTQAAGTFDYYIIADNAATWRGASPRGAEYKHYSVFVNDPAAVGADVGRPSLSLSLLGANPVRGNAALNFSLSQTGSVRLQLIDVSGRVVRTLVDGSMSAGPHAASWNGRDNEGRSLPSGLYFARLDAEGRSIVRRVLMVR